MSVLNKEELKERASRVAEALGYNINSDSLQVINVKDAYCMGCMFGRNELMDLLKQVVTREYSEVHPKFQKEAWEDFKKQNNL